MRLAEISYAAAVTFYEAAMNDPGTQTFGHLLIAGLMLTSLLGCASAADGDVADTASPDVAASDAAVVEDSEPVAEEVSSAPEDTPLEEPDVDSVADATDGVTGGDGEGDPWPYEGFAAAGGTEHDIAYGWIGAGQPTEARVTEVVELGARVLSLRYASEDPFEEQALVEGLGGTFLRYPTQSNKFSDAAWREGLYDLYDAQAALGGPVFLHCGSSDRVGATWALYHAERIGLAPEDALAVGVAAGLSGLESTVKEHLGLE